ncbi:MAG: Uma2 family endonuclease [Acidimicrobiia bacterium]|nr:Uma2 family endonuclease [Acidimicrobiia bacterium]
MASLTGITIEEFEKLPEALARNHELVDGELVDVSGNTPNHNHLRDLLVHLLLPVVKKAGLGYVISEQEYDFGGNAHGPDVSTYSREKRRLLDGNKRVQRFVPDLAIEIASTTDTFEKLLAKANRYRRCGTKEVWIFSIDLRQAVHLSDKGQVILGETDLFAPEQVPGVSIPIGELLDQI